MSNTRHSKVNRVRRSREPFVRSITVVPCMVCGSAVPVPDSAAIRAAHGESFIVCEGCTTF